MSLVQVAAFPVIGSPVTKPLTGAAYTGSTRPYLDFNATALAVTASTTLASASAYELSAKIHVHSIDQTNGIFQSGSGATDGHNRLRQSIAEGYAFRMANTGFATNADVLVAMQHYEVCCVDAVGDGLSTDITTTNLKTGAIVDVSNGVTGSTDVIGVVGLGADAEAGGNITSGHVWDVAWTVAGVLTHRWAIDEGGGSVIFDSVAGLNATLTLNTGRWVHDVEM